MSDVYSNNTKENQPRNMQEIASTDGQFESSILTHANDGNLIVPATYITQYYYNYGTGPQIGANNNLGKFQVRGRKTERLIAH